MVLELDTACIPKFRHCCNWVKHLSTDYPFYSSKGFYWALTRWPVFGTETMALSHTSMFAVLGWWLPNRTGGTKRSVHLETGMGLKGIWQRDWPSWVEKKEGTAELRSDHSCVCLLNGRNKRGQGQEPSNGNEDKWMRASVPLWDSPGGLWREMKLSMCSWQYIELVSSSELFIF